MSKSFTSTVKKAKSKNVSKDLTRFFLMMLFLSGSLFYPSAAQAQCNAGDDVTICLPKTNLKLADAATGQSWAAGAGNPSAASIDPSTGAITGMTAVGNYTFTLTGGGGCDDDIVITVSEVNNGAEYLLCAGESFNLFVQAGVTNPQWQKLNETSGVYEDIPGATGLVYEATEIGVYSYTATDAAGCDAELCCPVTIVAGDCCIKPNAGLDIMACLPNPTVDFVNATSGQAWSVVASGNSGTSTIDPSTGIVSGISVAGTYEYILRNTAITDGSCADTVQVTITAQPTPSVNDMTICAGNPAILTITNCSGEVHWLDGPITMTRTVSPPTTTTYSFTCTENECESEQVDAVVTVIPKPNAGPDVVICETTSTFDLPDAGTNQTWSVVSGTANINGTSGLVTGMNANGDYVFRLSPSPTFAGCTDEVMITRKPQPTPTVNSPTICAGNTATLTVLGCSGGTVRWSDASPLVIRPVTPMATTTYTFTCTIDGCVSAPVNAVVTVIPKPNAGLDKEICEPMMGIDLVDATAGQTWSFVSGPATAAITNPGGVITAMSANGDYIFKLSSTLAGCEDMVTVSRKPQPKPTVNSPEICLGETATLTVENCNGTVLWTSGSTAMVRSVKPTTTLTYSFVCTEDGCPSETITSTVTVNPLPVVTVTTPKIICDGTSVDLIATSSIAGSTFTWTGSAIAAPGNTATITVAPAGSLQENKEYIYTVTATGPKGCKATTETKVTVTPSLRVNAGVDQTICENGISTLKATTNLTNSQTNGTIVVTWSEATGNNNSGSNLAATTGLTVQTNALEIGEYIFIATSTQTSPNGKTNCVITDEIKVTVLREPSITVEARDESGIVTSVCNDGNSSATLAATLSADTPAAATIMWSSVQDPQLSYLSCTTCDNPTVTIPTSYSGATITYTAMATVTGDNNIACKDEAEITLTINKAAVLDIIDPLVICDGTSVQLDVTSDKSVVSYLWVGSPINDPTLKQPTVSSTGSLQENTIYTYTVQVEDIDGCVSEATTTVTVTPSIQVFAGSDKTICEAAITSLTATTNLMTSPTNGGVVVTWTEAASNPSSGSNLATSTGHSVNTNMLAPGEYLFTATVTQTSPDGTTPCVHTDEIKITVTQAPVVSVTSSQPNICGKAQETITLEAALSTPAAATYTWSSTNDPTLAFLSCKQCDAPQLTVPASYTGATITYKVKAVVTTDNNLLCEDEAEITIIVNPALEITPIENVTVCDEYISETETRTATLKNSLGANVNIDSWTITPMVGITNVVVNGANITFDVTPSNNQVEYTVKLTSAETCHTSTKFWAYETSRPIVDFDMDAFVCLESSVQVMFNGNAAPGATYTWNFAGAEVIYSNDSNPYDGVAEGPGPHDIKWSSYPGFGNTYTVNLKVSDGGCESNRNKSIRIERGYEVEWTSESTTACNAEDGTISLVSALERLTNRDVANTLNFTWTSTNGFNYFAAYPAGANLTGLAPGTYHVRIDNGIGGCNYEYDIDILRPDNIGLNALVGYKATCGNADGGIHTEAVGGTAPYTFSYFDASSTLIETRTIADSIDYQYGLTEGKYTVIVKDSKGCSTTGSIIIDNADGPRVEVANLVATACGEDQGEMEFTIFGAAPFSYEIFASNPYPGGTVSQAGKTIKLEFLAADDYIMEVTDANGCVTIVKFKIMSNAPNFNIAVTTTPGSCEFNPNGSTNPRTGAFDVTSPIGGNYTYTWIGRDGQEFTPSTATNPTALATGIYKLIVSDGTCVDSVDLVINPIEGPSPEIVSTENPSCPDLNDGSVTFTVNKNPDTGEPDKNIYDLTNLGPFRYTLRNTTSQNGLVRSGQIEEATEFTVEGLEEGTYVLTMTDRNECVGYQTFTITDNPNFEILVDRENLEVCDANDGMITFSIVGAAGGTYEVTINPDEIVPSPFVEGVETSIFGMSANVDYEVTVTDQNGCVATFPVLLTQPEVCFNCDLFAATDIESYDMICDETESGKVRVTVTGGTAPYNYKWYDATGTVVSDVSSSDTVNMVTGLMNGVYYVEVTDTNECSFGGYETRYFAKVSQSGGPVVDITSNTPAACGGSDGSIRFAVTGVLNFNYTMTQVGETTALVTGNLIGIPNGTTVSNLEEGSYVLSVTDGNGCTTTTLVDISSKVFPMNIVETITPPTCDGITLGEIAIALAPKAGQTAPAGQPVVTWNGPDGEFVPNDQMLAEALQSGNYTVTVTYPNGCSGSKDISLNAIDGPTLSAVAQASVNCIGNEDGSFTLNADGNGQPIIGFIVKGVKSVGYDAPYPTTITDEVIDGLTAGEYIVEVIGFDGCISTTIVEITKPIEMNILIQPTPVDDCDIQNGTLTVSMISGGTADFSIKFKDSVDVFTLPYTWTNLSGGDYVLEVTDADGCMATFPVTVEDVSFEKCYGTIGDYVWKDSNNDGVQDAIEEGVNDVKVILWSVLAGQPDMKLDSMMTKDGGMYLFDTLREGDYIVQLDLSTIPDSCYVSDSVNTGGDDEKDNDFDSATGFSPIVTLTPELGGIDKNNLTIDGALFTPYGSIGNYVWKDEDNDGIQDVTEEGVENVTVELWTAVNGNPGVKLEEVLTTGAGFYEFDSLLKGDYIVKILSTTLPEGCYLSDSTDKGGNDEKDNDFNSATGLSPIVSLDPIKGGIDQDNPTIDGALFTPIGTIGDYVWKDDNDNGVQDANEDGVNEVKVILWSADASGTPIMKLDSMMTENGGMYEFDSLGKGFYLVQVDAASLPETCYLSTKQDASGDDTDDSDVDPTTGISQLIELDPIQGGILQDNPTIDAALFTPYGSIGDYVWKDTNDNGAQDTDEDGVAGVKVILWSANGVGQPEMKLDSMLTTSTGFYEFDSLTKGDYLIQVAPSTVPEGCYISDKQDTSGDDANDSDVDPTTGISQVVMLDPIQGGILQDNPTIDAGLKLVLGSISNYVWKDVNDDGIQDDDEEGVDGIVMNLWSADQSGNPVDKLETTTTANGGMYLFDELPAGRYIVQIDTQTLPEGCDLSDKENQGGDDTKDNDFDATDGLSPVVTLDPIKGGIDQDNPTIDAGLKSTLGSIGNYVWKDTNDDGIQDDDEAGVNGVTVKLWSADQSGNPLDELKTTMTADGGKYLFDELPAGRYIVQIDTQTLPDGCSLTSKANIGGDDTVDSDFDSADGLSPVVTLNPVQGGIDKDNMTIDAGLVSPLGSIGNFVWKDANDNGIQDNGEEGVNGVTVKLWSADQSGNPATELKETTTANGGGYTFTDLPAGEYIIQVVTSSLPADCELSDKVNEGGDDTKDNDINPLTGLSPVVTLDPTNGGLDKDNPTIDAGLKSTLGSIGDFVWKDTNDNGIQDGSEAGVEGVNMVLWSADGSGNKVAILETATTNNQGFYEFTDLDAGRYIVEIDSQTLPDDCQLSDKVNEGGDDTKDNDFDPATGQSPVITLNPASGGLDKDNPTIDAGLVTTEVKGSIGNFVWKDTNNNGVQDGGEAGVNGVTVNLWSADASGNTVSQLATTTTANGGAYNFGNLEAGRYIVQINTQTLPDGCDLSDKTNQGGDDTKDSDFNPTNGLSPVVTLNPANGGLSKDNPTIDAGLVAECVLPILTVGNIECLGTTYSVSFITNSNNVTASAGVVNANKVTNIPLGTNVVITATEGGTCTNQITVTGPTTCPDNCTNPRLTVGQPLCSGGSTYSVSFRNNTGIVTATAGTIVGNTISGIPVGTNVRITATDGECTSSLTVRSPVDCNTENCESPRITLSAPICEDATYSVNFILDPGATIATTDGLIGNGIITNVPFGTTIMITVSYPGCPDKMVTVSSPVCEDEKGSIGNFVWKDTNDNGIQDNGEAGVNGVTVNLWSADASGNTVSQLATTTTANGGSYNFGNLDAGLYIIQIDTQTLPDGCDLSDKTNQGGDDNKDSDIDPTSGLSPVVTLDPTKGGMNKDNPTIDAALVAPEEKGSIGNFVWKDTNDNGIQDNGEAGVNGVTVNLWSADASGNTVSQLATTTTANGGSYNFGNLDAGQYIVEIVTSTLPDGCDLSDKTNQGADDTKDSDFNPTNGLSPVVTLIPENGGLAKDNPSIDAALVAPEDKGSIGNFVWKDTNDNGIQDIGEAGVNGVTVNLWSADASGNTISQLATTTTANGGSYNFGNLDAGQYIVEIVTSTLPDGCDLSDKTNQGGDDSKDSDFNPTNGLSPVVTLNPSKGGLDKDNTSIDAALTTPITGKVDVELTKTTDADCQVAIGDIVSFEIKVFRTDDESGDVVLSVKDSLTSNLEYVSYTASEGSFSNVTNMWTGISIGKNETATLTIMARVSTTMGGQGCNTAWVETQDRQDLDSNAGDKNTAEDDIAKACVSVPIELCVERGESIELEAPFGYTTYQWTKDGLPIQGATSRTYVATAGGSYKLDINAETGCGFNGCCPIIILEVCQCPENICVPFVIKKTR